VIVLLLKNLAFAGLSYPFQEKTLLFCEEDGVLGIILLHYQYPYFCLEFLCFSLIVFRFKCIIVTLTCTYQIIASFFTDFFLYT